MAQGGKRRVFRGRDCLHTQRQRVMFRWAWKTSKTRRLMSRHACFTLRRGNRAGCLAANGRLRDERAEVEDEVRGCERSGEERRQERNIVSVPHGSSCSIILWESGPTEINERDTPAPGLWNKTWPCCRLAKAPKQEAPFLLAPRGRNCVPQWCLQMVQASFLF